MVNSDFIFDAIAREIDDLAVLSRQPAGRVDAQARVMSTWTGYVGKRDAAGRAREQGTWARDTRWGGRARAGHAYAWGAVREARGARLGKHAGCSLEGAQSGVLGKIAQAVLRMACARAASWTKEQGSVLNKGGAHATISGALTKRFSAVVKTHKRRSNKIYKTELTKIKI